MNNEVKKYRRDKFENYFVNTSRGEWGGTPTVKFDYDVFEYTYKGKQYNAYYKVLYEPERNVIQLYFKETTDKTGWRANFDFASKYYDAFQFEGKDIQLKTATGWGRMYNSMKWYIRNAVKALLDDHPGVEIEIIGWSLGSALAQLCAQDLYFNYKIRGHVFTFGSVKPWYGKNKEMRSYLKHCYQECYNFGDNNDIVAYLVPFPGYFKMNKITVKQDKLALHRLFNPKKYHTEYWKESLYSEIDDLDKLINSYKIDS